MNGPKFLFEALQRAFTGKTTLVPVEEMVLSKFPSQKGSVAVGSIADDPILYALFCERRQAMSTLVSIEEKLQDDDNLMTNLAAAREVIQFKTEVLDLIDQMMREGIRAKFPETEGQGIEVTAGLMVCKFPFEQSKRMQEKSPFMSAIFGSLFHR